ncbi:MAG: hypothetical protein HY318_09135 [Armatimonadetes bacterium]|nr:hypothetical protein [Armatimonadota bacterium]
MTDPTASNHAWSKRLVLGAGCLSILVCFVATGIHSVLRNQIPPYIRPKTPQPNAFDYYVKAGEAKVGTDSIGEAIDPKARYSLARKEALLKKNAKALNLMRQAMSFECLHPLEKSYGSQTFQCNEKLRILARLKNLEGQTLTEKKEWARAANSYMDLLHFGKDLSHGGPLISFLVGKAVTSMGRSTLWSLIGNLSSEDAKAAARRLESIAKDRVAYSEIVQVDVYQTRLLQQDLARKATPQEWVQYWQFWLQNQFTEHSASYWITKTPESYAVTRRKANESSLYRLRKLLPDPYQTMDIYTKCGCLWTTDPTQDWLQAAALALHAYHLDHRRRRSNYTCHLLVVLRDKHSPLRC